MQGFACLAASLICLGAAPGGSAATPSPPTEPPEPETPDPLALPTRLFQQTGRRFASAILFAPDQSLGTNALARLAPLILLQTDPGSDPATDRGADWLGRFPQADGAPQGKPGPPQIQVERSQTAIRGQLHDQFTFRWSSLQRGARKSRNGLAAQGIRLTLDAAGDPVIWEVLQPGSGLRLFFVAQSLESKAADQFGAPLAHRHFSVERACTEQPKVWVLRLLDQGPIPMGPAVYLEAGTHSVTTLLCRCSPTQVDRVRRTVYYQLVLAGQAANQTRTSPPAAPQPQSEGPALETMLRLPDSF